MNNQQQQAQTGLEFQVKAEPDAEGSTTQQLAVASTPVDEWTSLRDQLRESPHNTTLWNQLVDKAEESGDLEKIKEAYEALLEKYPNTVRCFRTLYRNTCVIDTAA